MKKTEFKILSIVMILGLSGQWATLRSEPAVLHPVQVHTVQNPTHDFTLRIQTECIDEPERSHGIPPAESNLQYFLNGNKIWEKELDGFIDVKTFNLKNGDIIVAKDYDLSGRQGFNRTGQPLLQVQGSLYNNFFDMVESANGRFYLYRKDGLVLFDSKNKTESRLKGRRTTGPITDDGKRILQAYTIVDDHLGKIVDLPPGLRFLTISDNGQAFVLVDDAQKEIFFWDAESGNKLLEIPLSFLEDTDHQGEGLVAAASVESGRYLMLLLEKSVVGKEGRAERSKWEMILVNLEGRVVWESPGPFDSQDDYQLQSLDPRTVVLREIKKSSTMVPNQKKGYPPGYFDTTDVITFKNFFYSIDDQP